MLLVKVRAMRAGAQNPAVQWASHDTSSGKALCTNARNNGLDCAAVHLPTMQQKFPHSHLQYPNQGLAPLSPQSIFNHPPVPTASLKRPVVSAGLTLKYTFYDRCYANRKWRAYGPEQCFHSSLYLEVESSQMFVIHEINVRLSWIGIEHDPLGGAFIDTGVFRAS